MAGLMKHKMEPDSLHKHYWIWPIAWYIFLGGLGGGILFIVGLLDVLFGLTYLLAPAALIAVACLGFGSLLLIFELGQPKVFLRVFFSATAIIKWGACLLIVAMLFGFIYFLFYLPPEWNLFYYSWTWLLDVSTVLMALFGLCVVVYTGVLFCTMKSKPFWNTPVLPVLFTASALSTATAAIALCSLFWEQAWFVNFWFGSFAQDASFVMFMAGENHFIMEFVHVADAILIIAEIIILLLFVFLQRASGNVYAKASALEWISGKKAILFWVGMVLLGLLVPFGLYQIGGAGATFVAPVLVLAAGLLLRFMIVYSDQRRPIPGEERFYSRLPQGNERFLKGWKAPY